ncbi:hypothetical protein [Stutzerimonas nitrititolerans]|uniref:hypothetical protein n=1 Tax=Stutzerimonas nitrititolerans TaxID=2482751 RepID=UPI00289CA61A|nr:hypothetical protein [Stutzerimonas nitrititolerans]
MKELPGSPEASRPVGAVCCVDGFNLSMLNLMVKSFFKLAEINVQKAASGGVKRKGGQESEGQKGKCWRGVSAAEFERSGYGCGRRAEEEQG